MHKPKLALVVAVAENGVIGRDNELPWRLPSELKRFRALTMNHPLIMGRKTFESIGKPLPGRDNIVLTRRAAIGHPEVLTARSLEDAIALGKKMAERRGVDEIMVIGGAEVFGRLRERAARIYLTRVHMSPQGDTSFAAPEPDIWTEVSRQDIAPSEGDSCGYSVHVYERKK
jgi:dihydrofolate reductase